MDITLKNSSRYTGREGSGQRWQWTAFVQGTQPQTLNDIEYVEYHLHPSYKNPVRRVFDPGGGFRLQMEGWGSFKLRARVVFKDQTHKKNVTLKHQLQLERQRVSIP